MEGDAPVAPCSDPKLSQQPGRSARAGHHWTKDRGLDTPPLADPPLMAPEFNAVRALGCDPIPLNANIHYKATAQIHR
jgi:hypothetical protein